MGPIIVSTTLMVPEAIFTESFLAFIGIGISLPQASWGTLASEARSVIQSYPLQIVWPVLAICLTVLSLNLSATAWEKRWIPRTVRRCTMALLDVKNLCVDFHTDQGTVHAVRDISVLCGRIGGRVGIVGESGAERA